MKLSKAQEELDTRSGKLHMIRITITDSNLSDQIKDIARKCAVTEADVMTWIVREALPCVKLTERRECELEGRA